MDFTFTFKLIDGTDLTVNADAGKVLFVLGANGTGKSNLMHRFYGEQRKHARRISAHRQTWFSSNASNLSSEARRQTETNMQAQDAQPQARWQDPYQEQRASIAIYDLLDAENVRAREITRAVDEDDFDRAKELRKKEAPIKIINELLRLSNIPIEISVRANEQIVATKSGSPPYSIAELSDGERNALLIAANVLTVAPDTLILIDEPERHLHRSIISPLLTMLFSKRPDCSFVVSTHDVSLPLDNPGARTLLIRGCTYRDGQVSAWDADLLPPDAEVDEALKRDILGARRHILFVEGVETSLDRPIYSLVFPNVSVIAKSTSRDVEQAVVGIRSAPNLHWLRAFGIIDNDRRTAAEIAARKAKGVYALSVYSVEAIYYHPDIQARVAARLAKVTGAIAANLVAAAKALALSAIAAHADRLAERAVEKELRQEFLRHQPTRPQIASRSPIRVNIDVAATVDAERARLQNAIEAGDLSLLMARYPVSETQAHALVADALEFRDTRQYENAVRTLLLDDADALTFVRGLFDTLPNDLQLP